MLGEDCHARRADLVRGISVFRHTIAPNEYHGNLAGLHKKRSHVIALQGRRNPGIMQLKRRQPSTLEQRTSLIAEDMHVSASPTPLKGNVHRRRGSAIFGCRQGAGIAVCHDADRLVRLFEMCKEIKANLSDGAANAHVLIPNLFGLGKELFLYLGDRQGMAALHDIIHPVKSPKEVDSCRA